MLTIGQKIYLKRQALGLSQKDLARSAGIPQPNLSNIERDKQDMTLLTLRKIAFSLDVQVGDFFKENEKDQILNREELERIAHAIVFPNDPKVHSNNEDLVSQQASPQVKSGRETPERGIGLKENEIVNLFRLILPKYSKVRRIRSVHEAWLKLNAILSDESIRLIRERVQDVEARQK